MEFDRIDRIGLIICILVSIGSFTLCLFSTVTEYRIKSKELEIIQQSAEKGTPILLNVKGGD